MDYSKEILKIREHGSHAFSILRENYIQPGIMYPTKLIIMCDSRIDNSDIKYLLKSAFHAPETIKISAPLK